MLPASGLVHQTLGLLRRVGLLLWPLSNGNSAVIGYVRMRGCNMTSSVVARAVWFVFPLALSCHSGARFHGLVASDGGQESEGPLLRGDVRGETDSGVPAPEAGSLGGFTDSAPPRRKDCWPGCIAQLRAPCRGPEASGGACVEDKQARVVCLPNGVKVFFYSSSDAGALHSQMVTMPDGKTPCYYTDCPGRMDTCDYFDSQGVLVASWRYENENDPVTSVAVTCYATGEVFRLPNRICG